MWRWSTKWIDGLMVMSSTSEVAPSGRSRQSRRDHRLDPLIRDQSGWPGRGSASRHGKRLFSAPHTTAVRNSLPKSALEAGVGS
jgi:hypothetical protein